MTEKVLNLRNINDRYWSIDLPIENMGVDANLVLDELFKYSQYFGVKVNSIMCMSIQFGIDCRDTIEFIDVDYPVSEVEFSVYSLEDCINFFKKGFNEEYGIALDAVNPKVISLNVTFNVGNDFPRLKNVTRKEISQRVRIQVLDRDNSTCQLCGATIKDGVKLHVDHIVPISKGGTNDMDNLQTLCDKCNLGKGDFTDLNMVKRRLEDG